jgi:Tol biopolymer transport system component
MVKTVAAAVLAAALIPTAAQAHGGRIAYSRYTPDFSAMNIVVADADGSHARRLTNETKGVLDYDPRVSPDGRRILFERDFEDGSSDVVLMRADGSHERTLDLGCVKPCAAEVSPTWLGNQRIAFSLVIGPFDLPGDTARSAALYTARLDGSHVRRLSPKSIDREYEDYRAQPSPDGSYLLVSRTRNQPFNSAVFRMRPDGTHARRLTPWKLDADLPDLSRARSGPSADHAVFETYGHGGQAHNVATVPMNCRRNCTEKIHYVTHNAADGRVFSCNPAWSPNGKRIAFSEWLEPSSRKADDGHFADIFTSDPAGGHRRLVSHTQSWSLRPDWTR